MALYLSFLLSIRFIFPGIHQEFIKPVWNIHGVLHLFLDDSPVHLVNCQELPPGLRLNAFRSFHLPNMLCRPQAIRYNCMLSCHSEESSMGFLPYNRQGRTSSAFFLFLCSFLFPTYPSSAICSFIAHSPEQKRPILSATYCLPTLLSYAR